MKTVFVTKWLVTRGIVELDVIRFDGLGVLVKRNGFGHSAFIGKSHWHQSREVAEQKAAKTASRKIATLDREIAALKKWMPEQKEEAQMVSQEYHELQLAYWREKYNNAIADMHMIRQELDQVRAERDNIISQTTGREAGEK